MSSRVEVSGSAQRISALPAKSGKVAPDCDVVTG
jgi:hypothetical protein